jgi:hypothetical protein
VEATKAPCLFAIFQVEVCKGINEAIQLSMIEGAHGFDKDDVALTEELAEGLTGTQFTFGENFSE